MGVLDAPATRIVVRNPQTGALEAPAGSATVSAATVRQVGTRAKVPGSVVTGAKQSMSSSWHYIMSPVTRIAVGYPAWSVVGNVGEAALGASMTIRATIEYPAGTITRLTFSGGNSGTIPNGTTLLSDWLPITIPAGARVLFRQWTDSTSGALSTTIPQSYSNFSSGDYLNIGTTTADLTAGGAITNNVSGGVYSPCLILGDSTAPAVLLAGDSRVVGGTDAIVDGRLNAGDIARAVGQKYAYVNVACGGDTATAAAASYTQRAILAAYCTEAVVGYGINDLIARGLSASNTATAIGNLLARLPNYRRRVLTIAPVSNSTDSWATTANQTTHTSNTARAATNNLIRYSAIAGQGSYIEVSDYVETARDSGIWLAGYTVDGVHSTSAADTTIAAAQLPGI